MFKIFSNDGQEKWLGSYTSPGGAIQRIDYLLRRDHDEILLKIASLVIDNETGVCLGLKRYEFEIDQRKWTKIRKAMLGFA